jgi:hypothetical protein
MLRAVPRVVPVVILRRLGGVVAAARVVMVVGAPGSGAPIRYIATSIQQVDGEDGSTRYGITVYGTPIRVTIDGEAVGIVAGRCPRHRGGNGGVPVTIAIGGVDVIDLAGGGQHGDHCQECCFGIFFHIVNR